MEQQSSGIGRFLPADVGERRAIGAAAVGNLLEWYDFVVYSYLADIIARNFFPDADPTAGLLDSFAAFGLGFAARPLGAAAMGWIGDHLGRKAALTATIALMAVGTVLIGVIPSHAAIGLLAPILLVLARLLQGFSVGGEWGNAASFIVEWAPAGRRGYFSSFQQCSLVAGLLLGSGIAALLSSLLSPTAMEGWGWRIPFLLGGLIAPVGIYLRRSVEESPAHLQAARTPAVPEAADRRTAIETAQAFGFMILWAVQFYIFLAYMPTFTMTYAGIGKSAALWSNTAGLLLLMVAIPPFGHLSDRIGRKPVLLASCAFFALLPYPLFRLLAGGASIATVLVIQLAVALAIALYSGAGAAAITEIFPTHRRATYLSIANGTAVAIFGGFAPYIATWLIRETGSPLSPTVYVIAAAIATGATILTLRETATGPLR